MLEGANYTEMVNAETNISPKDYQTGPLKRNVIIQFQSNHFAEGRLLGLKSAKSKCMNPVRRQECSLLKCYVFCATVSATFSSDYLG